ncbi:MAG: neutral/alkaline non-lysosomal ceramidase N-terminal domain-containing protein [Actinobacteria bacterium]|nr:neutral/alkaline non-lysosomal ceramidase N-terminal domain-containing protein [Actinomycetota bacterium]
MRFGLSKIDITPKIGNPVGFGQLRVRDSTGIYNRLYARSFYLCTKLGEVLFVACDLLFLSSEDHTDLRQKISESVGVKLDNVFISTTHIHSGPPTMSLFDADTRTDEIFGEIKNKIIYSAEKAKREMLDGKMLITRKDVPGLAFNRRIIMKDDTVETYPYKDDPNILKVEGPDDPELGVLFACDNKGVIKGGLINFSCHPTVLRRSNDKFAADFPGFIEEYIQKKLGEEVVFLYLNGACGNIGQVNVLDKTKKEVGIGHSRFMGARLADEVLSVFDDEMLVDDVDVECASTILEAPIRDITEEMLEQAMRISRRFQNINIPPPNLSDYGVESYRNKKYISVKELLETDFWKKVAANEILVLASTVKKHGNLVDLPISTIRINNSMFITVPSEFFVEHGLKIKELFKSKYTNVFVVELCNGYVGYIPTKKAFSRMGSYETQFLTSSKLAEDTGEKVVETVINLESTLGRKG